MATSQSKLRSRLLRINFVPSPELSYDITKFHSFQKLVTENMDTLVQIRSNYCHPEQMATLMPRLSGNGSVLVLLCLKYSVVISGTNIEFRIYLFFWFLKENREKLTIKEVKALLLTFKCMFRTKS